MQSVSQFPAVSMSTSESPMYTVFSFSAPIIFIALKTRSGAGFLFIPSHSPTADEKIPLKYFFSSSFTAKSNLLLTRAICTLRFVSSFNTYGIFS